MRRRINLILASTKWVTIILIVADFVSIALYHKWRTIYYFQSLLDYITSLLNFIKLLQSILPAIAIVVIIFLGIILELRRPESLAKRTYIFFRNTFLQSYDWMIPFIFVSVIFIYTTLYNVKYIAPPEYTVFVDKLLDGETNGFKAVDEALNNIKQVNPNIGSRYASVVDVFKVRWKKNIIGEPAKHPAKLVQDLKDHTKGPWANNPLLLLGLAEAYSLKSQEGTQSVSRSYTKSTNLFQSVQKSTSPLATELLRKCALNLHGNLYLYHSNYSEAISIYQKIIQDDDYKNLSTWANLIAAHILNEDIDKAIETGLNAKDWAENKEKDDDTIGVYASILENLAYAYWHVLNYEEAHKLIEEASILRSDDHLPVKVNLAVSNALLGKREIAVLKMYEVQTPARTDNVIALASNPDINVCHFAIWAAILPSEKVLDRAANLSVLLQETHNQESLEQFTVEDINEMTNRAVKLINTEERHCESYPGIKKFISLLLSGSAS